MPAYKDPPSSNRRLDTLLEVGYKKNLQGLCSSIVSFPGAGISSELKYLSRHVKTVPDYANHVITFLDLDIFENSEDAAIRESLSYIISNFSELIAEDTRSLFDKVLASRSVKFDAFLNLLHTITFNDGLGLSVVVDSFYLAYSFPDRSPKYSELLHAIKKVNPMKITLTFIASHEFNEVTVSAMGRLSALFVENVICGKDIPFDKESAKRLIVNQENRINHKFSPEFISKTIELSINDPSVMKIIATLALTGTEFVQNLLSQNDINKSYDFIGTERLNQRYFRIVDALQKPSIDYLLGDSKTPTDFLINTGLIYGERMLNPLFKCFLDRNHDAINNKIGKTPIILSPMYEKLSSQELSVFRLLESKPETVISKDEIAKAMWGDDWEHKYSAWAVDQLVSRLRSKLKDLGYGRTIKSVKGKGLMLI